MAKTEASGSTRGTEANSNKAMLIYDEIIISDDLTKIWLYSPLSNLNLHFPLSIFKGNDSIVKKSLHLY